MIPRSIWRWMILDIKRKKKEKRIQLLGGLIGICVSVVSLFYFFHAEKEGAEKRMVEIVNYVKVQCSTYTHYNESSESKSLLRAIESARQMSTNINMETENGGQLSQEFLIDNLQPLWVDGILVLDAEGKTVCKYSMDEALTNEIIDYLQKDIIMDFTGYEERSYSERIDREDGSRIDIAACARKDAPGMVAIYYYTSSEFVRNYTLTIQNLLNGYSTQKDGTIIVADKGTIVASNDESLLGQDTAGNQVVQAMKEHTDSQHIFHLKNEGTGGYGIMLKQRDYYIYAYLPDQATDYTVSLTAENTKSASVFDVQSLSTKSQYNVFFGGTHPEVVIDSASESKKVLMVFKDSYANCFVPFLIPDYARIFMIDPRYYTEDISETIQSNGVTDILFLYNANTAAEDHSLYQLTAQ